MLLHQRYSTFIFGLVIEQWRRKCSEFGVDKCGEGGWLGKVHRRPSQATCLQMMLPLLGPVVKVWSMLL